jgi:hypothetical protein
MDVIFQTWPWYVSGFIIGLIMLTLPILRVSECPLIYDRTIIRESEQNF